MSGRAELVARFERGGSPSTIVDTVAQTWDSCTNDDFLFAGSEAIGVLSKTEKYTSDTDGEKARVRGFHNTLHEAIKAQDAGMHQTARTIYLGVANTLELDPAGVAEKATAHTVSPRLLIAMTEDPRFDMCSHSLQLDCNASMEGA